METFVIPDNDGKGVTYGFVGTDIENVNPIAEYKERVRQRSKTINKALLRRANRFMARFVPESFYEKEAEEEWNRHYDRVIKAGVSKNFIDLLSAKTKKDQERLLRGQTLTADQLAELIFRAYDEHGFTYSKYTTEHLPKGVNSADLPEFIHVKDDGKVKYSGETTLKDGQLKQVITDRKVTVAHILEKGDDWHCIFCVYRSLRGEETWNNSQPHFHYISDKWTNPKADIIARLKSENYPSTSIHIGLNDYGGKGEMKSGEAE